MHRRTWPTPTRSSAESYNLTNRSFVSVLLVLLAMAALRASSVGAAEWVEVPGQGARWLSLPKSAPGKAGFAAVPADVSGLRFTNTLDELSGAANRVLYNGSGIATGDYDGDGRPDVFLCNLTGRNALFRNLGDWKFEETTAAAGLGETPNLTRGAVFADINGDRNVDLLLSVNGQGVRCYLNDGKGKFTDTTAAAGTASRSGSTTLALADVDGNGTLDLYITNYRPDDIRDRGRVNMTMVNGRPMLRGAETNRFLMVQGRLEECGQPDQLLLNDGTGKFTPVSWTGGAFLDESGKPLTEPPLDWGLTATFRDVNGDGAPDLYVCNDYWTPDRFWINDGKGRFQAIATPAVRKTCASSMSADFADIDRDGDLDLFVVDMLSRYPAFRKRQALAQMPPSTPVGVLDDRPQVMRNTLLVNQGDTTFAEIAAYAGLEGSDWSWSAMFLDVDLDGFEDLLIGAGHFRDVQDIDAERIIQSRQRSWANFKSDLDRQKAFTQELMEHYRLYPKLDLPIGGFRNRGDGSFEEVTDSWGLSERAVHQGLALADFDSDGDLDLAVNHLNSGATLLRNETSEPRISVRLKGRAPNTHGIGARVTLHGGAKTRQSTEIIAGGRYQSGSVPVVTFAASRTNQALRLEVQWRNGARSVVDGVEPQRLYEIDEDRAASGVDAAPARAEFANRSPWFEDVSRFAPARHKETEFNDFDRQPLLPYRVSQLGPGVAWADLDGDGREDLLMAAARGGSATALLQKEPGRFSELNVSVPATSDRDGSGILVWSPDANTRAALLGLSGWESPSAHGVAGMTWKNGQSQPEPATSEAGGMATATALALGDLDGTGKPWLFVGGGPSPNRYPFGAPSRLFRWTQGRWVVDQRSQVLLENLGVVNGAVWTDVDGDGTAELALASEWGSLRLFQFQRGVPFDVTKEWGLEAWTGWWRGITAGDLNGDGRMDLIASNWGWNSVYRASAERPLVFLAGEMAQPGVVDIVETEYPGPSPVLAPRRSFLALARSLPFLLEKFVSHKQYSEATVEELLGDRLALGRRFAVNTLASMAFLNTGKGFQAVPLPREAQWAPAFAVSVADADGDGHEDVFLSQNLFAIQPETTRIDAGSGLWLKGDGRGGFAAVQPAESGVRVSGEQRGAAVADFDGDGRVDLAVTQNGAPLALYRNRNARPGLRVRLMGPPGNLSGIGAAIRVGADERWGPTREIHGGSGYWSQDSAIQVLAVPNGATTVQVRWPGGVVQNAPIPEGAKEVVIDFSKRG
ncbi:MAG: VCBS repeat-containing protein [Verrucomicrobiales bacterium]|nr:VCBS repeat-containing protein [Verrucomicrobiales bacterium]